MNEIYQKYEKISAIALLIEIISLILIFFYLPFAIITIISGILSITYKIKARKIKNKRLSINENEVIEANATKEMKKEYNKINKDEEIREELVIDSNLYLNSFQDFNNDYSSCNGDYDRMEKEFNTEDKEVIKNEEEDFLNKKLSENPDLYLSSFENLNKYNINCNLDKKHIDKLKRSKEVEYEKFVKAAGTTERPYNFVVFDLETTGLSATNDEIIEIGAIRFEANAPTEIFHTYVKPKKKISKRITLINGITNEMVENSPTIEDVIPKFLDFIKNDVLIAHNSNFDMGFILNQIYSQGYKKIKNKTIDTLKLARQKVRDYDIENDRDIKLNTYKLDKLKYYLGLSRLSSHNSIDDCKVCAYLYIKIRNEYGGIYYI